MPLHSTETETGCIQTYLFDKVELHVGGQSNNSILVRLTFNNLRNLVVNNYSAAMYHHTTTLSML